MGHRDVASEKDWSRMRVGGLPVPLWWKQESAVAFRDLETRDTDIIMASYQKTGTSWLHQIIYCLLRMDDAGQFTVDTKEDPGGNSQLYPDALPQERPAEPHGHWGYNSLASLMDQPEPRLFSSHQRREWLPEKGLAKRGRFVYMLRNPKDTMTSMHFFLQKLAAGPQPSAKDRVDEGWFGDEQARTLGTFGRWNAWPPEICPEAYGSYYSHVRYADELIQAIGPERATVFYYEGLQEDFDGEVRRLAAFLEVPLSDAKLQAIREQTNPDGLKNRGAQLFTFRSGTVGDHKKHAEPLAWAQMDQWFEERLGDVHAAQPLRKWM